MNNYPKDYVADCHACMDAQLAAYKSLLKSSSTSAVRSFEPLFFGNLVLTLECCFVHRARGIEGNDGNPLNEARMIAKFDPAERRCAGGGQDNQVQAETSVLKLKIEDKIELSAAEFARLAEAFFAEIELSSRKDIALGKPRASSSCFFEHLR